MRRGMGRAARAAGFGAYRLGAVAALALTLAGCASDTAPILMQAQLRGPSIAFESIDGPPLPIFQKLVADLSAEAEQRQILVVSRAGQLAYRVRGYLAALMSHGKTHIGWVWDVYDAQKHSEFRLAAVLLSPLRKGDIGAMQRSAATNHGAIRLVAGNSNRALSEAIAAYLDRPLARAVVRRFADMEIFVEIQENVRGADVFVLQSTSYPANDHLMELLIIIDALRRASARRVTAVIPYFGYARQDRKVGSRSPISAKLVANLITRAGADRIMTLDLHAGQIQGFFDIPADNLYASPVMVRDIRERFDTSKLIIVPPDVGGVVRARGLAKRINAPLTIIDKRRERAGESEVMNVIGEVEARICILVDDIIDSGGTLINAADALLEQGAREVYAYISHGVLSGGAVGRITASGLKELVITDSIQPTEAVRVARNIRVLSIASLIGEAIGRTATEESVSSLFD